MKSNPGQSYTSIEMSYANKRKELQEFLSKYKLSLVLGLGSPEMHVCQIKIMVSLNFLQIVLGDAHKVIPTDNGDVYQWFLTGMGTNGYKGEIYGEITFRQVKEVVGNVTISARFGVRLSMQELGNILFK